MTVKVNTYACSALSVCKVCELGEQLEQEKARCEGLVRQDRQEVSQFFQTLEAALARKRQAYLEALDKAGAEVTRAYDPLIHRVKELQVGVHQILAGCSITHLVPAL